MFARSMYTALLNSIRTRNLSLDLIVFDPLAISAEGTACLCSFSRFLYLLLLFVDLTRLAVSFALGVKAVQAIPHLSTLGKFFSLSW